MSRYSVEQQTQIIKMKSEGVTSRSIAKELGLSKSGVNDFYNRISDTTFSLDSGVNGERLRESVEDVKRVFTQAHKIGGKFKVIISDDNFMTGETVELVEDFGGPSAAFKRLGDGSEWYINYNTLEKINSDIKNHTDDCRKSYAVSTDPLVEAAKNTGEAGQPVLTWFKKMVSELNPVSDGYKERKAQEFKEKIKVIEEEHKDAESVSEDEHFTGMKNDIMWVDDVEVEEDNSVILFISDMHIPYHHKNLIPFLKGLKDKYNPTRVICLGDEWDNHALSFHDSDPDLMSAGDELKAARKVIKQVEELFPVMDLVDSNHGSLAYRKAKHHGIPQHFIKGYNEVLGVGEGWKWHHDLTIKLPSGEDVYICHGKAARGVQLSQNMGMSVVQGHHHSEFNIHYWANPKHLHFSIQAGCLIDDKSLAMAYNKLTLKRPIIGTALIVNGVPVLEAMSL